MTLRPDLFRRLRTVTARSLVRALEKDGFTYRRRKGSGRVYRSEDGRRVILHYHASGDTFPIGTLRSILKGTRWTEDDLRRLRLI